MPAPGAISTATALSLTPAAITRHGRSNAAASENGAFLVEAKVGPKDDAGKQHTRNFWPGIAAP